VIEIPSELPANVTPLRPPPKDPTAAERKRRSRARQKQRKRRVTPVTEPVTPGAAAAHALGHVFDHGHGAQHIGAASIAGRSSAIRDAAKAAGEVSQIIEFPASKPLTDEPVITRAPLPDVRPDISADNSRPEIAPSPVSLPIADTLAYTVGCGLAGIAAWFSLKGLAVLFPGAPREIVVMGAIMECAKLVACGWLAGAGATSPRPSEVF
jgi:hypothetical protein